MPLNVPRVNGIPLLGAGTFPLKGDDAVRAVTMALEIGIRHIDTAQMYGNEAEVGQALRLSSIPRQDMFIVTKVDPGNMGEGKFAGSVARSMELLGGPADLLLIHWPPEESEIDGAIDRLLAAQDRGMTRMIGVSNFSPALMRRAQARAGGLIVNNQVEFHPLLDQKRLLAAAKSLSIVLSAYTPLARGAALKNEAVTAVANRLGRPASEVVLRWILQQGVAAIPMTTKRDNALSNTRALAFELTDADMAALSAIGTSTGRLINPSWMAGRWDG